MRLVLAVITRLGTRTFQLCCKGKVLKRTARAKREKLKLDGVSISLKLWYILFKRSGSIKYCKVPRTSPPPPPPPPVRPQRETLKKMASFFNDRISWTINVATYLFQSLVVLPFLSWNNILFGIGLTCLTINKVWKHTWFRTAISFEPLIPKHGISVYISYKQRSTHAACLCSIYLVITRSKH